MREQLFDIHMIVTSSHGSSSLPTVSLLTDLTPPVIILEHDGKWKDYYEQISDTELNCYAQTCSINLTAERSYDPEGWKVRYIWYYGWNDIKTSKDPWNLKLSRWDHDIWLRVIDSAENVSSLHYIIHVLGPKENIQIQVEKEGKKKIRKVIEASVIPEKPKLKKIKMVFFTPPDIHLQWKTLTGSSDVYRCIAARKSCQINLALTGTSRSDRYEWQLPDGSIYTGKNPKWWTLPIGKYTIELRVYKSWETVPYWIHTYTLVAEKKITQKKWKVKKNSSKKKSSVTKKVWKILPSLIENAEAYTPGNTRENTSWLVGSLIFLAAFALYYLRIRRKNRSKET